MYEIAMLLILSVLAGITLDFACAKPADPAVKYYASKYDHIDVETILNNRRMVNYYSACLLSRGPCPPEGVEFKRILPEALLNNCGRCTEKQATVAFHAIKRIRKEYPKIWDQLSEKWDPDGIYVNKFESTFRLRNNVNKVSQDQPLVLSSLDSYNDDEAPENNIGGSFSSATTTSHQNPTTHKVLTTTNSISSSTIITSTKTTTGHQHPPHELVSNAKTTTKPNSLSTSNISPSLITTTRPSSSTTSRTTSRPSTTSTSRSTTESTISTTAGSRTSTQLPIIPGLIPLNTFFTNPPIPVRPLINLNIGANIEATVSGLVRGLGALGTRVMETGADIAEVVIKNFARPLRA